MPSKTRLYKVTDHKTNETHLVAAYNAWQATAYAVRDDVTSEPCSASDAARLGAEGVLVKYAVKKHES